MAVIEIEVSEGAFKSLQASGNATTLTLPTSLGLVAGDTLNIFEIDSASVRTGAYGSGNVSNLIGASFFNLPNTQI
jgi:hypothetical protein